MTEALKWHNERRKVDDLLPYKGNPRRMTEQQAAQLRASIEKFDLVEVPAINTDNTIVAGHMRLKTMQLLGRGQEEIDVRVPSRALTEEELKEYNLRSNKNVGEFDMDLLANFDEKLLLEVGFEPHELLLNTESDNGGMYEIICPNCDTKFLGSNRVRIVKKIE